MVLPGWWWVSHLKLRKAEFIKKMSIFLKLNMYTKYLSIRSWFWNTEQKPKVYLLYKFTPLKQSMKVKVTQSCPTLCDTMHCIVHGILQARILEWVVFPFSRGIFPTQQSNPGLPYWRQILYQLSHKGSARTLEWVASPFSSRSSQSRNWTGVSRVAKSSLWGTVDLNDSS